MTAANEPKYDLFSRPARRTYKVSELTNEVKGLLEGRFPQVQVEGEISNFVRNTASGHCYFTLKDEMAQLKCALFRTQAQLVKAKLADGLHVLGKGRLTVYPQSGQYQMILDTVEPIGAGALALRFEELKKRLAAEGLFEEKLKRKLPFIPRRIGVVSSPTGAAIQDFLRVLHKRWPDMPVLLAPARMQGDNASSEIARALLRLGNIPDIDVIVVTRGGGSLEDLWPFNEEQLARAIRRCPVPVVSAVGHEVDFTIADFAADKRAPTPTGAAELIVPVKADMHEKLTVMQGRLRRAMERALESRRTRLLASQRSLSDPRRIIGERRMTIDRLSQRAERIVRDRIRTERATLSGFETTLQRNHPKAHLHELRQVIAQRENQLRRLIEARLGEGHRKLASLSGRLDAMSPLKVLSRGYSLTFGPDGTLIRKAIDVSVGDRVKVRVAEGSFDATVNAVDAS